MREHVYTMRDGDLELKLEDLGVKQPEVHWVGDGKVTVTMDLFQLKALLAWIDRNRTGWIVGNRKHRDKVL